MRAKRIIAVVVGVGMGLLAYPAQAIDAGTADVGVTMRWVGQGTPRARAGGTAVYAIVVTNFGPDAATGVALASNVTDHFNKVSLVCTATAACTESGTTLGRGGSFTATLTVVVCCFVTGETRDARASAILQKNDPNATNDLNATNDNATVDTKMVGPHRD